MDAGTGKSCTSPVAVITGATGAIGGAVARDLARTHVVWLIGRDRDRLEHRAPEIGDAKLWVLNLANTQSTVIVPPELDRVDVLVLSAGLWSGDRIENTPAAKWQEVFAVNLFGHAALTAALLPLLRSAHGRVILLGSTATTGSPARRAAFTASKAALSVFGHALHEEERDQGVQVTEVIPGRVASRTQERVRAAEGEAYDPEDYMTPEVIAGVIRSAIDTAPVAHVESVVVRPVYRRLS